MGLGAFVHVVSPIWCFFWWYRRSKVCVTLLPFTDNNYKGMSRFQQDNASAHTSKTYKDFFMEDVINFIELPAKYPDLNPIDNLWVILELKVYAQGKQYCHLKELKEAISDSWEMYQRKCW